MKNLYDDMNDVADVEAVDEEDVEVEVKGIKAHKESKGQKAKRRIKKGSSFILINLIGTAIDTLILWIFSDFIFHGSYWGEYYLSPLISFECSVLANYTNFYFITWRDRIKVRSIKAFWKKYFFYNISSTGVFLIKMAILLALQAIFKWDVVLCNLVALCISGVANFVIDEWVIFRKKK